MADGSVYVLKTINYIARDSRGRTRNEARKLISASYEHEPPVISVHIYDPVSSLDSRLDPDTLIAKQTLHKPPVPDAKSVPVPNAGAPDSPVKREDLGTRMFQQMILHGTRQSRSPNDVDEFWYSPDLSIYISRKHQDPVWEQTINVTELNRTEPDPSKFIVPTSYKIVKVEENQYTEPVPGPDGVYPVRGEVLPPRVLSSPTPKFPPQLPKAFQGAVVVSLVVDGPGKPSECENQTVRGIRSGRRGHGSGKAIQVCACHVARQSCTRLRRYTCRLQEILVPPGVSGHCDQPR